MSGRPAIPAFRPDGSLPERLWKTPPAEVLFRFGTTTFGRRRLALRVRRWIQLAGRIGAMRLLVDGSFVTAKPRPAEVDAVVLRPRDFDDQLKRGDEAERELETMLLWRHPEELRAVEDDVNWNARGEFFRRTREPDGPRTSLVEIEL